MLIAIAGLVGLAINRNVQQITDQALAYDVNLDDEGDDLRAAVLDVRHYHRNLFFLGPDSPDAETLITSAYDSLRREIVEYREIGEHPGLASANDLLLLAERYFAVFQPAIDQYDVDRAAFNSASEEGLELLNEFGRNVEEIERTGEDEAAEALERTDAANHQARIILVSVLGGMVLIGGGLAWSTARVTAMYRQLYEVQRETSARLAESSRLKTNFIADASHELRTPLAILRGNAEAGLALDSVCVHRDILNDIVAESAQMTKLVGDLLLLARSDANSLPLAIEPIEAELFSMELAERARVLVAHHHREFAMSLAGHGLLRIDESRLAQAVMVLVDNAAKYSPPGSTVRLISATRDKGFVLEVVDNGPGLPAESLATIFDRFVRLDQGRSRLHGGAGLGLSIARTIVEAHNGRIEILSSPGAGTTARIVLPLAPANAQPIQSDSRPLRLPVGT